MTSLKYRLSGITWKWLGREIYRIVALKDFSNVKRGDLGGWIESEDNLSHEGDAWVYSEAKVLCNARVYGNAKIFGKARVYGNAKVHGNSEVFGNAEVYDDAEVTDDSRIYDDANIYGNAKISISPHIYGYARVYDNAEVSGMCIHLNNEVKVCGNARVIYNDSWLKYGELNQNVPPNHPQYIACTLNVAPINGKYYLYELVRKISNGIYLQLYTDSVVYHDGEITEEEKCNEDIGVSFGRGLHVSTPFRWKSDKENATLIGVEVDKDDVITCLEGKLRVRKLRTLGEVII